MKTKWIVLLTAMASFTLFTLFAYCTKDTPGPAEGGLTTTEPTIDLAGTTWKTIVVSGGGGDDWIIHAHFTSSNAGNYTGHYGAREYTEAFTYSLNSGHGAIINNMSAYESLGGIIPNNATLIVIDENTIGIGGRVFTKQ